MSRNIIPQDAQNHNHLPTIQQFFAAMIPGLTISQTSNPRRHIAHPSGWRFTVEGNEDTGPLVLASPPGYSLTAAMHLVEGPAALRVMEMLEVAQ